MAATEVDVPMSDRLEGQPTASAAPRTATEGCLRVVPSILHALVGLPFFLLATFVADPKLQGPTGIGFVCLIAAPILFAYRQPEAWCVLIAMETYLTWFTFWLLGESTRWYQRRPIQDEGGIGDLFHGLAVVTTIPLGIFTLLAMACLLSPFGRKAFSVRWP